MSNEKKAIISYGFTKLAQMLIVLICLSVIVFVIARLCPGDPLRAYYGDGLEHMSLQQQEAAREELGLKDSLVTQYGRWISELFSGNLGLSYQYKQPVQTVIGQVWGNTLLLGGTAYVLTFGLAIALGQYCVLREKRLIDRILCKVGVISGSIPSFFTALLLIWIFGVKLGLLPTGGAYSLGGGGALDRIYHLILPVSVLVLEHLWYYAYMVRNRLIEETRKDYVLFCKAKGLPRRLILRRHCMRNTWPSLLTVMAAAAPHILGGTYVVESVFSYPGLGSLSFEAAVYQDYNMLMALCLLTGIIVLVFNLAAQTASAVIDPRTAREKTLTEAEAVG